MDLREFEGGTRSHIPASPSVGPFHPPQPNIFPPSTKDPFSAKDALQASNFDPEAAAELLLLAGAADDLGLSASSTSGSGTTAAATAERGTRNRWGKKAAVALQVGASRSWGNDELRLLAGKALEKMVL